MIATTPLLELVRGLIERTYRLQSGLGDLGPFVIGDTGFDVLYSSGRVREFEVAPAGDGMARTLIREKTDGIAACIYFPDAMIRCLEQFPPQHGLLEQNSDAFATFVEEIDHLLVIAERASNGRPVSLFELELHANVSKYLVLARFLAPGSGQLEPTQRIWLRRRLLDDSSFCDRDPDVRERYREAARWAGRLVAGLAPLEPEDCIETLRSFHRVNAGEKLRIIRELPA